MRQALRIAQVDDGAVVAGIESVSVVDSGPPVALRKRGAIAEFWAGSEIFRTDPKASLAALQVRSMTVSSISTQAKALRLPLVVPTTKLVAVSREVPAVVRLLREGSPSAMLRSPGSSSDNE